MVFNRIFKIITCTTYLFLCSTCFPQALDESQIEVVNKFDNQEWAKILFDLPDINRLRASLKKYGGELSFTLLFKGLSPEDAATFLQREGYIVKQTGQRQLTVASPDDRYCTPDRALILQAEINKLTEKRNRLLRDISELSQRIPQNSK